MVEQARLSALYALDILDSDPEPFFDAITRAAQASLGMPIALIAFVDDQRQWFKSQAGFDCIRETPRDISFCHWAILSGDVFEIEDASVNAQFAGNPLVAGPPYVRHYVGAPIEVEGGSRVGTLCLLSPKVGRLTTPQISTLQCLAQVVATGLDQRAKLLKHIERGAEGTRQRLCHSNNFFLFFNTASLSISRAILGNNRRNRNARHYDWSWSSANHELRLDNVDIWRISWSYRGEDGLDDQSKA